MAKRSLAVAMMQARRRGPFRTAHMRGDPGLFGSIGKVLGKALPIAKVIPGVGNVLSAVSLGSTALGAAKAIMKRPPSLPQVGGLQPFQVPRMPSGIGGLVRTGAAVAGGAAAATAINRMTQGGDGPTLSPDESPEPQGSQPSDPENQGCAEALPLDRVLAPQAEGLVPHAGEAVKPRELLAWILAAGVAVATVVKCVLESWPV